MLFFLAMKIHIIVIASILKLMGYATLFTGIQEHVCIEMQQDNTAE